jgi:anti-sigma factor RsiW
MSCSPFDLRDYFFGELLESSRREVELHNKSCEACREELSRLRATESALLTLRDEEIPQRIGFISDRVYEPSVLLRWWKSFWSSAPRLGFASAVMLSVAILVAAMQRPVAIAPPAAQARDAAQLREKLQSEFSRQLDAAVEKVVAETEARSEHRTAELLAAAEKRFDQRRKEDMQVVSHNFAIMEKYARRDYRATVYGGER